MILGIVCLFSITLAGQSLVQKTAGPDSVKHAASNQYSGPTLLKLIFMGKNYRKEWATPVTLPQFDLSAFGMKITGLGGGWQTKSLQLIDADSTQWVLRTVDKELSTGVPEKYRNRFFINIMQDMVSGAYPYAPLVITGLARATKVPATDPVYYYVPHDNGFGQYKEIFAGKICMLERREVLPGDPVTVSTTEMLDEFLNTGYSSLDMKAYLKVRLLDMLIGDWDRHQDQWIWSEEIRNGNRTFVALPKDRDQALFFSNGLLVKIIPLAGYKHFVGLQKTTKKLINLNAKSWNLDKLILNGLDKNEWQAVADKFVADLPDSTIKQAVKAMPPEVYAVSGEKIERKLIGRKNTLAADAMNYFDFLSESVVLYGTDQQDHFSIQAAKDSVLISVITSDQQTQLKRAFYPGKTKEITLLGFGGDDKFTLTGELSPAVLLKMDGGTGSNSFPANESKNIKKYTSTLTTETYRPVLHEQLKIKPE